MLETTCHCRVVIKRARTVSSRGDSKSTCDTVLKASADETEKSRCFVRESCEPTITIGVRASTSNSRNTSSAFAANLLARCKAPIPTQGMQHITQTLCKTCERTQCSHTQQSPPACRNYTRSPSSRMFCPCKFQSCNLARKRSRQEQRQPQLRSQLRARAS